MAGRCNYSFRYVHIFIVRQVRIKKIGIFLRFLDRGNGVVVRLRGEPC